MKYPLNYKNITTNTEYYLEVMKMQEEAIQYLSDFNWCKRIINFDLYLNLGSKLCVFLFEIENSSSTHDNHLWITVGDLPSMYLDIHGPKTVKEALEDYVNLAEEWITHIKLGRPVNKLFPFIAKPTVGMAELLEKRTNFIKGTLINNIDNTPITIK